MKCDECPNRARDGGCGLELMNDFSAPSYPATHECHVEEWSIANRDKAWRKWTADEDAYIRRFRRRYGDDRIARELGRTKYAVRKRAGKLGVTW